MRGCSVEGCEARHRAHGFCNVHYQRWLKKGDPLAKVQLRAPDHIRFWNKVERTDDPNGCWHWKIKKDLNAYGQFRSKELGPVGAHRFAFYLANGFLPEETMHTCDVRSCVNPRHLVAGTRSENMRDMVTKQRHRKDYYQGSDHHMAKLTDDDVRAIRASTEKNRPLANRYGVEIQTIRAIQSRKTWKHID